MTVTGLEVDAQTAKTSPTAQASLILTCLFMFGSDTEMLCTSSFTFNGGQISFQTLVDETVFFAVPRALR